jgi:hypothetical protein
MNISQRSWYPWLVVALLWVVAMLNYLDRQMLSTMKSAIMVALAVILLVSALRPKAADIADN